MFGRSGNYRSMFSADRTRSARRISAATFSIWPMRRRSDAPLQRWLYVE